MTTLYWSRLLTAAIAAASLLLGAQAVFAEDSADGLWSDAPQSAADLASRTGGSGPIRFRSLRLNTTAMRSALDGAPDEYAVASAAAEITLPLPDGGFGRFDVEYSPVMAPALAARYPSIRTYRAVGVDDPHATARLSLTPKGFNAHILSPAGAIFIDPSRSGAADAYLSYHRRDFKSDEAPFQCGFADVNNTDHVFRPVSALVPSGDQLTTHRLAVATTGEYTQFHGGTVVDGLAAVVTTMNRVNNIYERELAVRMELVANNDGVIFTNQSTDPYSNFDGFAMLGQNQTELDATIGTANYDIGHVLSTGGGGIASLGAVCRVAFKAQGVTGRSAPLGDPFDVDYVAHEIGHQYNATHTFNGTTSSCGGGNRTGSTAFEPGSGTTVMGYAGICGSENIQPNSDAHFHAGTYDQIINFTTFGFGSQCGTVTPTGNNAPAVDAGADFDIPADTPFTLTGSADDPEGHSLTYAWEQMDLGAPLPPQTDDGSRPLFRSFLPSNESSRTFPQWSDILAGTTTLGERLPTTTRDLNFRLTAFDNQLGGGGVDFDEMVVSVTNSAGPFAVAAPNSAATNWQKNGVETVLWNVANTDVAPVSCANVDILFSSDGGVDFSVPLAQNVPNDGSHDVVAPDVDTVNARVMVRCSDNIFFDVSDNDFTVADGGGTPSDINQDGCVDRTDLIIVYIYGVLLGFQSPVLDANVDGNVDFSDVIEVFLNYTNPDGLPCI